MKAKGTKRIRVRCWCRPRSPERTGRRLIRAYKAGLILAWKHDSEWLEQLARVYARTEERDKQIAALEKLVKLTADDLESRKRLVKLLVEKGDHAEVEKYARQALEIDVTDKEVREALYKALKVQRKDDERERMEKLLGK